MTPQPHSAIFGRLAAALESDWPSIARPSQLPPAGGWRVWLLLAGRGFGKTRSGAEWVRSLVEAGSAKRIALVAATAADARDVIVEGESGILAISPDWNRPQYEPSKRRLTWPNGAIATCFSADEPERLRGPQHDAAWCDELATWRYPDAWDNLMLGLRLGTNPRCVVTTTPKPVRLIRQLIKREGADVAVTRGTTSENRANLAPQFIAEIMSRYSGTRLGRQELDAELLEDLPGALWQGDVIDRARVASAPDELVRIVVAIDPSGGSGEDHDKTGIIVAGVDSRGHGFILADLSGRYAPTAWARKAIGAYRHYKADRIIAETNYGGAMVEATVRAVDASVSFKEITSSRGKVLRAEPVSAFYEQGRVHHVGIFAELEGQMTSFTVDYDRAKNGSPDRLDAAVFALTELMVNNDAQGFVDHIARLAAEAHAPAVPQPRPRIAAPAPPPLPATIALKAPAYANFCIGKNRYAADAEGILRAELEDVKALCRAGCALAESSE